MYLTKTDFTKIYLKCPKTLWLSKYKPEIYKKYYKITPFEQNLAREGYEVEKYAKDLLPKSAEFQKTFQTENITVRPDFLIAKDDGTYELYEVKSSTKVKRDQKDNHIKDICFQKIALERAGIKISKTFIVHLNNKYIRKGDLDIKELFIIKDLSKEVEDILQETELEIEDALMLINQSEIDESSCSCLQRTRSNHCDCFDYFNKNIPKNSIYKLARISEKKIIKFNSQEIFSLSDIQKSVSLQDFSLNEKHLTHIQSVCEKCPIINSTVVKAELNKIKYPIHFFDYETIKYAIPKIDGTSPHRDIPFQYSLHKLNEDGSLEHYEYLSNKLELPNKMVKSIEKHFSAVGSVVVWNESFEKRINKELGERYKEYKKLLTDINNRIFDLEKIFSSGNYMDYRFEGRSSIKNILPVLCPSFSYKNLNVKDGTEAMDTFSNMIKEEDSKEKKKMYDDLLKYCNQDTLSMLEIFKVLKGNKK